ncbi:hypothetical protein [Spirosoma foliorum]|uniref:Uncharacterized protein n=1 Tax=Spirosoma foliorum TaxID=2710596 RepID=A0A7G5GUZ7_9BACT|nr:hypothetical protein [Spirosoma foliorum]QMW02689.1 hypothetical protein H3H32_33110 [Spirosoma foliorum]
MYTLMTQVTAQNAHIQSLTLCDDVSDIDYAFARLEGLFQQVLFINPGNSRLLQAWVILDQQARPNLRQLTANSTGVISRKRTFISLQEKISHAVALL